MDTSDNVQIFNNMVYMVPTESCAGNHVKVKCQQAKAKSKSTERVVRKRPAGKKYKVRKLESYQHFMSQPDRWRKNIFRVYIKKGHPGICIFNNDIGPA